MNNLIKIKEASELTGLKPSTIRNLVCSGELKAYKQGKFLVFRPEELKEWLEKRTEKR